MNDLGLTVLNADAQSDNDNKTDLRDSDAIDDNGVARVAFTVGAAGENNHTLDIGYKPLVDISLEKTVNPTTAKRGDSVIYTLTVSNQSDNDASGVVVTDLLAAELKYQSDDSVTQFGEDLYDENTGQWSVGSVPANSSKSLNLTIQVR